LPTEAGATTAYEAGNNLISEGDMSRYSNNIRTGKVVIPGVHKPTDKSVCSHVETKVVTTEQGKSLQCAKCGETVGRV
jgi:hypothetical protein